MKLFQDRNKTLLPRIDMIFFLTRVMTLAGFAWFLYDQHYGPEDNIFIYVLGGSYAIHAVLFYLAVLDRFDLQLAYLSGIVLDLLFVPSYILQTGGLDSSFYLLCYLTASVAAYMLTFWFASAVALLMTVSYIGVSLGDLTEHNVFGFSMRLGFLWVFFLAISYASQFLRRSESRLLKLFDTLNLRTQELERSQAQVEMIYENSRILASLLDTDGVVHEVIRILSNTLQFESCALIFRDRSGNVYYRARAHNGHTNYHLKAIDPKASDLITRVMGANEPVRIKDVRERDDYVPLKDKIRSVMIVPLTSHGRTAGLLVAEASAPDQFKERDMQMLSIVARAAALALENAELHKRTEELTVTDELTETWNYRYFVAKLMEEKKRAVRYNLPLSIIMVDIDWFKKLNDSYGHEAGNAVLRELSRIIKSCIRDTDIFARYGGEEFVIILPQTPLAEARVIGERIREKVEKTVMEVGLPGKVKITVSVGVSAYPENGKSQEELVSVADQALYRAKGSGKNVVCTV